MQLLVLVPARIATDIVVNDAMARLADSVGDLEHLAELGKSARNRPAGVADMDLRHRGREADGARVHRFRHDRLHGSDFSRCRRARRRFVAQHIQEVVGNLEGDAQVAAEAGRLKREGVDVVDFSAGEPDFPTPKNIKDAAIDALNKNFTKYTPISGTPELKQAICDFHKDSYGTSYLAQWNGTNFGVARVTGSTTANVLRTSDLTFSASSKILFGDWNWHPNRQTLVLEGQWHNYGGRNRYNMGYADGHAEFYEFPAGFATLPAGTGADPTLRPYW